MTKADMQMAIKAGLSAISVYLTAKGIDTASSASIYGALITVTANVVGTVSANRMEYKSHAAVKRTLFVGVLDGLLQKLLVQRNRSLYMNIAEGIGISAVQSVLVEVETPSLFKE